MTKTTAKAKRSTRRRFPECESWRAFWRHALAPVLPTWGLRALRDALVRDDPTLVQGNTTVPPPLTCVADWPVEGACAVAYCGWKGESLRTVGQLEAFFAQALYDADTRIGEPAACRYFLNWYDDTPREKMRADLLAEVELVLAERDPEPAPAKRPRKRKAPPG